VNSTRESRKVGPMTNTTDDMNEVQSAIAQATGMYELTIRDGHTCLQRSALPTAFLCYTTAMSSAWQVTLLLSDDDDTGLEFWRNEMSNAQQLCTTLAVLLKARNMVLPIW
jgi:hypothetical protein